MSDIVQVQDYLHQGMLSCDLFNQFNIVEARKFLLDSEISFDAIWQNPRQPNGRVGAGFFIEMPRLRVEKPNSLQRNLIVSIVAIEERNLNMDKDAGTTMSSEDMAELALDFMFNWSLGLSSGFTPEKGAVTEAPDIFGGGVSGLLAYRASVTLRYEHNPIARCAPVTLTEDPDYTFALATATADADIYYTLDNSFPGKSNPAAVKYTVPFTGAVDQIITAAAWRGDLLPSHLLKQLIT